MNSFNEIERKFLVDVSKIDLSAIPKQLHITQGYILRANDGSARVRMEKRIVNGETIEKAWLVIKQKIDDMTNDEIVCDLSIPEALQLLEKNCKKPHIFKKRYVLYDGVVKWEIDEFFGHKAGLVMAEVELQKLSTTDIESLKIPNWVIREVTGEAEYYNVNM